MVCITKFLPLASPGNTRNADYSVIQVDLIYWEEINQLPPSNAVRKQKKNISEDLSSSVLSQFKKYHPCGNLKFNCFCIFQSLKLSRILMETILPISLKLISLQILWADMGSNAHPYTINFRSCAFHLLSSTFSHGKPREAMPERGMRDSNW